jgi:hypothetical protein
MRTSTFSVVVATSVFAAVACGQVITVYEPSDATTTDAAQDFSFPTFDAAPDVAIDASAKPHHDGAAPEASTDLVPCLDAGADAQPWQTCPPPPASYCSDQYAVEYAAAKCSDAGTCTYPPSVGDCLLAQCSGCASDDAGHAECNCIIPE